MSSLYSPEGSSMSNRLGESDSQSQPSSPSSSGFTCSLALVQTNIGVARNTVVHDLALSNLRAREGREFALRRSVH